jgi:hypothetical protein
MMNHLAFDIETARIVPDGEKLHAHRPLGITCYALAWRENNEVVTLRGYGEDSAGEPQPQMSRAECRVLVEKLSDYVRQGYTILTWNGLGFDFDILAEESGMHSACCELALNHVDMMFHFFCLQGRLLGLNAAAKGMGLEGKPEGMDGAQAPVLWQQRGFTKVLEYVTQDVTMTLQLAEEVAMRRQIRWQTRTGKPNRVKIDAWLPVHAALELPLPKGKWTRTPIGRERFTAWLEIPR